MKRTEATRTTGWEATCEDVMLRSWVTFERSGDSFSGVGGQGGRSWEQEDRERLPWRLWKKPGPPDGKPWAGV